MQHIKEWNLRQKKKSNGTYGYEENCHRQDCKFLHPDHLRPEQQNIYDKNVFHDQSAFEDEGGGDHAIGSGVRSADGGCSVMSHMAQWHKSVIRIGQWNIQRNIFGHEVDLSHILVSEEIDMMFLSEVD